MTGNQGGEATVIDLAGRRGPRNDPPPTVVRDARRGDHRAFTELVDLYDDGLRALAFHLLGSREAMDEALQEIYLSRRLSRPAAVPRRGRRRHLALPHRVHHLRAASAAAGAPRAGPTRNGSRRSRRLRV